MSRLVYNWLYLSTVKTIMWFFLYFFFERPSLKKKIGGDDLTCRNEKQFFIPIWVYGPCTHEV